jgi:hypothetical protein
MLEKPDELNRKLRDVLQGLRPRSEPVAPVMGTGRRAVALELMMQGVYARLRDVGESVDSEA